MPITRAGRDSPSVRPKVARVFKGKCHTCFQPIIAGEAYIYDAGSNTSVQRIHHCDCYWLKERKLESEGRGQAPKKEQESG